MARRWSVRTVIAMRRLAGQLQLLIGFLSLGTAAVLFRIESKRLGSPGEADQAFRLLSLMMAGALAMIIAKQPENPPTSS